MRIKHLSDVAALLSGRPENLRVDTQLPGPGSFKDDPKRDQGKSVLVFGPNGFVGLHVLNELLHRDDVRRVVAIARPKGRSAGADRLSAAAQRFSFRPSLAAVELHDGTIARDDFGLPADVYDDLVQDIDIVINCAGSTNHAKPYMQFRRESVKQYFRILEFCHRGRHKAFHTLGSLGGEVYTRWHDFYRTGFYHCGYSRMKWVLKHVTRQLAEDNVPVHIYMAPFVLGSRHTDYRDHGLRYSFWEMIKFARDVGQFWASSNALVPVMSGETLAKVIVNNAFAAEPRTEMYPGLRIDGQQVADAMSLQVVPWAEFRHNLRREYPLVPRRWPRHRLRRALRRQVRGATHMRALFPGDLPRLMDDVGRQLDPDCVPHATTDETVQLIVRCARANRILPQGA